MNPHPPKFHVAQLLAAILLAAFVQSASAQVTFLQDSFATFNTNTWTRANTGSATNGVSGGFLQMNAVLLSSDQRAVVISTATNLNPFVTQDFTMTFSNLTIGGTPTVGTSNNNGAANLFYALLGNANNSGNTAPANGTGNTYNPGNSATLAGYLSVSIAQRVDLLNAPFTQILIDDKGASNAAINFVLSGTPTSFTWAINGTNKTHTLSLIGATFTNTGLSTLTSSFSNFSSAGLSSGSYLAMGAMNRFGTVTTATTVSLDEVLVTAIPEPSTLALLTIAGVTGLVMLNRRRRGLK